MSPSNTDNPLTNSPIGFITGRFQIFHNGHLEYALQAVQLVDTLLIGVCNPDDGTIFPNQADSFRHLPEHNPFTYWERLLMIKESLLHIGLKQSQFEIVPCPINKPELISSYIPPKIPHLTRVYDEWGYQKIRTLQKLGYESHLLYKDSSPNKKRTAELVIGGSKVSLMIEAGKDVRQRLLTNNDWQTFVPQGTAQIIKQLNLIAKLRRLQSF